MARSTAPIVMENVASHSEQPTASNLARAWAVTAAEDDEHVLDQIFGLALAALAPEPARKVTPTPPPERLDLRAHLENHPDTPVGFARYAVVRPVSSTFSANCSVG